MSVPGSAIQLVPADQWRSTCEGLVDEGGRFLALYAVRENEDVAVRAAFDGPQGPTLISCTTESGVAESIVPVIPAAGWDEREAHDAYGVDFEGHRPLRALLAHPDDLSEWVVPVHGHDPYQVAVGPIHAGVIESGHFRFRVVGESILHVDLRLFYKHRGLERAAEGRPLSTGIAFAQRACAACAVSNSVAYAQAVESLQGYRPSPRLARVRTLLLELERLYNHLNDIGAACAGIGFAPGNMAFSALKERVHRLNQALSGHRFLFETIAVSRSPATIDRAAAAEARAEVETIAEDARRAWREVLFNASVQDRFLGVGRLSLDDALRLGTVGPAARASGLRRDARSDAPGLEYPGFEPASLRHSDGDVAARVNLRALEVDATVALLHELLARPAVPLAEPSAEAALEIAPGRAGIGVVESPRGETVCVLEAAEGLLTRMHLRTGSYANWPSLAHAAAGNLLPDFPLINKSFELCYSCSDR